MSFFKTWGYPQTMLASELDIHTYIPDGFVRVCTAETAPNFRWIYTIHDESVMFDTHTSWVYFIVCNNEIVKVGETGMPLGIRQADGQPVSKSNNRFGRYRGGAETDAYIRRALYEQVKQGQVTLWARKCPVVKTTIQVGGVATTVEAAFHKQLELAYMDQMEAADCWPRLNKLRK